MISADRQQLADKILKLLELANSTTFAAEAETARRMAASLMQAHNITPEPGKPPQDTIETRPYVPFAKGAKWEGIITGALCRLCSCTFLLNDKLDSYTLIGSIWNLDTLEYMIGEITRQRKTAWLNHKGSGCPDSYSKFCYGFAQALATKIKNLIDAETARESQTSLISWYETNVRGRPFEKTNSSLVCGPASSSAGWDAGSKASLHRGSLSGERQKLIGT